MLYIAAGATGTEWAERAACQEGGPAWRLGRRRSRRGLLPGFLSGLLALGCHDLSGLAGPQPLPSGIQDPKVYRTAAGALALYQTTVNAFQYTNGVSTTSIGGSLMGTTPGAFVDFMLLSGLLTDELQAGDLGCTSVSCVLSATDLLDARQLPEGNPTAAVNLYSELQGIRNDATVGIGALAAYDPTASPALQGQLHALAGYAELMLADLYCSGVPLSTLNFNGTTSYTYAVSSTTLAVYAAARAQFDTALALAGDSTRILNLARVGKGRAWLGFGQYDSAAAAVAVVPDDFSYQFFVDWNEGSQGITLFKNTGTVNGSYSVSDEEGLNGLPYISSEDPRTAVQEAVSPLSPNAYGTPQYVPVKYGGANLGTSPITVADGIEARLIRAEAALHAVDLGGFLTQLNAARALAAPGLLALPPDSVPSTDSGRVTLLFRERAYDLFLTGHRQGDLRRLIRQYHRTPDQVYPIGFYPLIQLGTYGSDVTVPIPTGETVNPHFHGCISHGA